jgi:hypothetical protein
MLLMLTELHQVMVVLLLVYKPIKFLQFKGSSPEMV